MSQGQFFDLIARVDDILHIQDVESAIPELQNLLQNASVRKYFFENLQKTEWLQPLADSGFFATIPSLKRDSVKNTLEFPLWPESRFLARMASVKPDLVLEIIKQIPDTDNTRVYEDFADAALKMPPELAAHLLEKAKTWARSPYQLLLPKKLGSLTVHLAKGGQIGAALELAGVLLEVIPVLEEKVHLKRRKLIALPQNQMPDLIHFITKRLSKNIFQNFSKQVGPERSHCYVTSSNQPSAFPEGNMTIKVRKTTLTSGDRL